MTRKVYIIGPNFQYKAMFEKEGWEVVDKFKEADLIQFTGGEDVDPSFYGEKHHQTTYSNIERDRREQQFFKMAVIQGKQLAGICRGGQFLNVMNGGRMWQHVNGHAITGTHEARDLFTGEVFQVTSTHHQMMIPSKRGVLIVVASEASWKERIAPHSATPITLMGKSVIEDPDPEVIWYKETQCLCFQPHPEYEGYDDLRRRYFEYLINYLYPEDQKENVA